MYLILSITAKVADYECLQPGAVLVTWSRMAGESLDHWWAFLLGKGW